MTEPAVTRSLVVEREMPHPPEKVWRAYLLVLLMAGTGVATAILAGLPAIVFGGLGTPLPSSSLIYPTPLAHGYLAALLAGLIGLHVLAAFHHQFVRRDGLLRMYFGRGVSNQ
jgi:cytochrome b561